MISSIISRRFPQLIAVTTAAVTLFVNNRIVIAAKSSNSFIGTCIATNPLFGYSSRNMATSTTDGTQNRESILVGALRKAGINKSPKDVTDKEWARILSPTQYAILREADTERPFTGEYLNTKDEGIYHCAACGAVLFESKAKFDSHCGWPSFYDSAKIDDGSNVGRRSDNSMGVERTEIYCKKCGSHLGHVFNDGPMPTGERHCVNSVAIEFTPTAVTKK